MDSSTSGVHMGKRLISAFIAMPMFFQEVIEMFFLRLEEYHYENPI